jgi:hypothetical protein
MKIKEKGRGCRMSHSIWWAKQSFNGIGNLGWEDDYELHIIFGSTLEQVIPYTYEIELNVHCHVMIRFIGYFITFTK